MSSFEQQVHEALDDAKPYCVLPNVAIYRPDFTDTENSYAFEIDNLLHFRADGVDRLMLVEAKNQPVRVQGDRWEVVYTDSATGRVQPKDVKRQLLRQVEALKAYLRPLAPHIELLFEAWVVSSDETTPPQREQTNPETILRLVSFNRLLTLAPKIRRTLRVTQSQFLGILRLGIPVPALGHPEVSNALTYLARCRRAIDGELFRSFRPFPNRWAINGSAGMGKSVLLGYGLYVLSSNHFIRELDENGGRFLDDYTLQSIHLQLPPHTHRNIYAFAMKEKQRQVLENIYNEFITDFEKVPHAGEMRMLKPAFRVWDGVVPADCNVLFIDEAHDLSEEDQASIAAWHQTPGTTRYLAIACDRHQKLQLVGPTAPMLRGINFSLRTRKLERNYRNPFPVFAAGLALMFRWFADSGPKVMPSKVELRDGFGFDVEPAAGENSFTLSMRNDAHPANAWSQSITVFPDCLSAYVHLQQHNLNARQVLWVRFAREDPSFNYERLGPYTYHNFHTTESAELVDKYVKGQEFDIVVVEGLPDDIDNFDTPASEDRAWTLRKQLYLCCSRATAFLLFVPNCASTETGQKVEAELQELVSALSLPVDRFQATGKTWRFTVPASSQPRDLEVFQDNGTEATTPTVNISRPITVASLATALGLKTHQINRQLVERQIILAAGESLDDAVAAELARGKGMTLKVQS